jgi:hypothetical protein
LPTAIAFAPLCESTRFSLAGASLRENSAKI